MASDVKANQPAGGKRRLLERFPSRPRANGSKPERAELDLELRVCPSPGTTDPCNTPGLGRKTLSQE